MALEDFIGTYEIKAVEGALREIEALGNQISIRLVQGEPIITSSGSREMYQNVRYDGSLDQLIGELQTQPVYMFKVEAERAGATVICRVPIEFPSDLGSWTAEDDEPGSGGLS